jgi:hypothetical protein
MIAQDLHPQTFLTTFEDVGCLLNLILSANRFALVDLMNSPEIGPMGARSRRGAQILRSSDPQGKRVIETF